MFLFYVRGTNFYHNYTLSWILRFWSWKLAIPGTGQRLSEKDRKQTWIKWELENRENLKKQVSPFPSKSFGCVWKNAGLAWVGIWANFYVSLDGPYILRQLEEFGVALCYLSLLILFSHLPLKRTVQLIPPSLFFFIAVTLFPFNTEFYFILHLFWPCLNFLASDFHLLHNISIQKREKSWVNPLLGTPLLFHFVFSHHWVYTWSRCNFWKETGISVDAHYGASLSFRVWLQKI